MCGEEASLRIEIKNKAVRGSSKPAMDWPFN